MSVDPLSREERSERMSRVRSTGNRSTETKVEAALTAAGVSGWEKHPKDVPGRPDFYFRDQRLMLYVDGCFWHACPRCARRTPSNRSEFWRSKIDANRRRDNRQRRKLRAEGFHVMRVWEHDLKRDAWTKRLSSMLLRLGGRGMSETPTRTRIVVSDAREGVLNQDPFDMTDEEQDEELEEHHRALGAALASAFPGTEIELRWDEWFEVEVEGFDDPEAVAEAVRAIHAQIV